MPRSKRVFKERTYWGNKPTKIVCTPDIQQTCNLQSDKPRPSSSSKKKVSPSFHWYQEQTDDFQYDIIDISRLAQSLSEIAVCKLCHCALKIKRKTISGIASELVFQCSSCEQNVKTTNCESIDANSL